MSPIRLPSSLARVGVALFWCVQLVALPDVLAQRSADGGAGGSFGGIWHRALEWQDELPPELEPAEVLNRAKVQLGLGRPQRAKELLDRHPIPRSSELWPAAAVLVASAEFRLGNYQRAARYYAALAARSGGVRRGIFLARAALAFEKAGLHRVAALYYRRSRLALPEIGGWLALREARLTEDLERAGRLLRHASGLPPAVVARASSAVLWRAGNLVAAEEVLAGAGLKGEAAETALSRGDTVRARRFFTEALGEGEGLLTLESARRMVWLLEPDDEESILKAVAFFRRSGATSDAWVLLSRVLERAGQARASAELVFSSAQVLEQLGRWGEAVLLYGRAASLEGDLAVRAAYAAARLVLRLRGEEVGSRELVAFAKRYPGHSLAASALLQAANSTARRGRWAEAEKLYRRLLALHSDHPASLEARLRLGDRAGEMRRYGEAAAWYLEAARGEGNLALAARDRLARTKLVQGDTAAALELWTTLAREDSLGYYGLMAREAAGLPGLVIDPPQLGEAAPKALFALAQLNLLDAVGMESEARLLIDAFVAGGTASELLTFAEALLSGRRTSLAISLGWRAARELTLNDPRVLRVVFPWPWRDLIEAEARKFDLDPYLLAALIRRESNFRPAVVSRAGAVGLMQLIPSTAAETASRLRVPWDRDLLTVPDANVHLGVAHLAALTKRYGGEIVWALAAYNAGGRAVDRWRRLPGAEDPVAFVDRIGYPETRGYVQGVVRDLAVYRALYSTSDTGR
jgi:soluble lytic murein transglycosylase